jgi:hypothetical protein
MIYDGQFMIFDWRFRLAISDLVPRTPKNAALRLSLSQRSGTAFDCRYRNAQGPPSTVAIATLRDRLRLSLSQRSGTGFDCRYRNRETAFDCRYRNAQGLASTAVGGFLTVRRGERKVIEAIMRRITILAVLKPKK